MKRSIELNRRSTRDYVMELFDIEPTKENQWHFIDGQRRMLYSIIYRMEFKDAALDEDF